MPGDPQPPAQPIACDLQDHIEVACLFGYLLRATRNDGAQVTGKAITIETGSDKIESLALEVEGKRIRIALHEFAAY